jgi:hypothetical protein
MKMKANNAREMNVTPTLTPPPGRPKFADPEWLAHLDALADLARLEDAIDELHEASSVCRAPAGIAQAMMDDLVLGGTGYRGCDILPEWLRRPRRAAATPSPSGCDALAKRLRDDGFHRRLVEDKWFAVDLDLPGPGHWRALLDELSETGLLDDLRGALEAYDLRGKAQPELASA